MRILDQDNNEIVNPNLEIGYLIQDRILISHHEAIEAVDEQGHYEVEKEHPETGGKTLVWIVDVPRVYAQDAWDEYEDIQRYVLYTKEELDAQEQEKQFQQKLKDLVDNSVSYNDLAQMIAAGVNSI